MHQLSGRVAAISYRDNFRILGYCGSVPSVAIRLLQICEREDEAILVRMRCVHPTCLAGGVNSSDSKHSKEVRLCDFAVLLLPNVLDAVDMILPHPTSSHGQQP